RNGGSSSTLTERNSASLARSSAGGSRCAGAMRPHGLSIPADQAPPGAPSSSGQSHRRASAAEPSAPSMPIGHDAFPACETAPLLGGGLGVVASPTPRATPPALWCARHPGEVAMAERRSGIIMHGVTGPMAANQHLIRSILAIRAEGGIALADGTRVIPEPLLVGRNPIKLEALADAHGLDRFALDLDAALEDTDYEVFFDAASTRLRAGLLQRAIAAGKHVYCEKPVAETLDDALAVYRAARDAGIRHGVVQDELWLPGLLKLKMLIDAGFFGRILSVKGDFGYWVFEGDWQAAQRPSWNYKKAEGGGIILDMLCHWRYVLDNLFGDVRRVFCLGANHIPERVDERGERYAADADDAAYAVFELEGG